MARNDERLIEQYAGLAGSLNRLNQDAAEIFQLYEDTKKLLEQERAATASMREEMKRQAAESKRLAKLVRQNLDEAREVRAEYERRIAEADALKEEYARKIEEAEEIRRQIMSSDPLLESTLDKLTRAFDYNSNDTVAETFRAYQHIGPVVVRRPNWPVDQGFLVRKVVGNKVFGVSFLDGRPVSNGPTPRADSACRIFHGPSQRDIFRYALRHGGEVGEKPERGKKRR